MAAMLPDTATPREALDLISKADPGSRQQSGLVYCLRERIEKDAEFAEALVGDRGLVQLLDMMKTAEGVKGYFLAAVCSVLLYQNGMQELLLQPDIIERIWRICSEKDESGDSVIRVTRPAVQILIVAVKFLGKLQQGDGAEWITEDGGGPRSDPGRKAVHRAAKRLEKEGVHCYKALGDLISTPDIDLQTNVLGLMNILLQRAKEESRYKAKKLLFRWHQCGLLPKVYAMSSEEKTLGKLIATFTATARSLKLPPSWMEAVAAQTSFDREKDAYDSISKDLFLFQQQQGKIREARASILRCQETARAISLQLGLSPNYHPTKRFADGGGIALPGAGADVSKPVEVKNTINAQELDEVRTQAFQSYKAAPDFGSHVKKMVGPDAEAGGGKVRPGGATGRRTRAGGSDSDSNSSGDVGPPEDSDSDSDDDVGPPDDDDSDSSSAPSSDSDSDSDAPKKGKADAKKKAAAKARGGDAGAVHADPNADGAVDGGGEAAPGAAGAHDTAVPAAGAGGAAAPGTAAAAPGAGGAAPGVKAPAPGAAKVAPGAPRPPSGPKAPKKPGGKKGAVKIKVDWWKGGKSKKAMRALHWDVYKPSDETASGTVWNKVHFSLDCGFDLGEFEEKFQQKERVKKEKEEKKVKKTEMMEMKKFQNISIMLHKMPPLETIMEGINMLDDQKLPEECLGAIIGQIPKEEDITNFNGNLELKATNVAEHGEQWEAPELFYKMIIDYDANLFQRRATSWQFSHNWSELVVNFERPLRRLRTAIDSIHHSRSLPFVLGVLLGFGNMMNAQAGNKANVGGFLYNVLSKLEAARDITGKVNLLQHLVHVCAKQDEESMKLVEELKPTLNNVDKIKYDDLDKQMQELEQKMKEFDKDYDWVCDKIKKQGKDNDPYISKMKTFKENVEKEIAGLKEEYEGLRSAFTKVTDFWGLDATFITKQKVQPENLLTPLVEFLGSYRTEVEKMQKEMAAERKKAARAGGKKLSEQKTGGIDDLVTSITDDMISS